jgi:hypothetical protein
MKHLHIPSPQPQLLTTVAKANCLQQLKMADMSFEGLTRSKLVMFTLLIVDLSDFGI